MVNIETKNHGSIPVKLGRKQSYKFFYQKCLFDIKLKMLSVRRKIGMKIVSIRWFTMKIYGLW